jgi:hypothetical protein
MPKKLADLRAEYPELAGLDDEAAVDALHQAFYSDMDRGAVADALGVKPPAPKAEPSSTLRRVVGDTGVSLLKGAVAVPEAAVGLADLVTGGRAGKMAEEAGFRPAEARQILDEWYSPEQRAAYEEVRKAEGLMAKTGAALRNPSVIAQGVAESLPLMGAGAVPARALVAAAPRAAVAAGAAGEGIASAGSAAEQIRQQTGDGLLTGEQARLAAGSGVATGLLGYVGGKVAKSLGIADVDTMLAGAARDPVVRKGVVRRVLEGVVAEGVLEELPQSVQEQVAQNLALGKPLDDGVDEAAVLGTLTGGLMGGAAQMLQRPERTVTAQLGNQTITAPTSFVNQMQEERARDPSVVTDVETKPAGPLARAVQRGAESGALAPQPIIDTGAPDAPAPAGVQPASVPVGAGAVDPFTGAPTAEQPSVKPIGRVEPDVALARMEQQVRREQQQARSAAIAADKAMAKDAEQRTAAVVDGGVPADAIELDPPLPGDVLNPKGEPFKNRLAAQRALKQNPGTGLTVVQGGWVLRKDQGATDGGLDDVAAPAAGPAGTAESGRGDDGRGLGDMGAGAADAVGAVGGVPAEPVASVPATEAVEDAGKPDAALIEAAANEAATSPSNELPEPTQAQKEAGNYKLGHATWNGLGLSFENPKGSERKGVDPNGQPWSVTMPAHYGYVKRTEGADGDHVDIYMGDKPDSDQVFVVDQQDAATGKFDEHKVILGTGSLEEAASLYDAGFSDGKGPQRRAAITPMGVDKFKAWLREGDTTKPVAAPAPGTPDAPTTTSDDQDQAPGAAAAPAETAGDQESAPAAGDAGADRAADIPAAGAGAGEATKLGPRQRRSLQQKVEQPAKDGEVVATEGDEGAKGERKFYVTMVRGDQVARLAGPFDTKDEADSMVDRARTLAQENDPRSAFDAFGVSAITSEDHKPGVLNDKLAEPPQPAPEPKRGPRERRASAAVVSAKGAVPPAPLVEAAARPLSKKVRQVRENRDAKRAAYFTPGNIVPTYGGFDEVLSYQAPDENGRWSVTVHRVAKEGEQWVREGKPQDARTHSTEPDARAIEQGPVVVLPPQRAADVPYSEPRADGKPFPNAAPRGEPEVPAVAAAVAPAPAAESQHAELPEQSAENDRDHFTLERGTADNTMEKVSFARGEYVRVALVGSDKSVHGEIDGISHARREFSVDGLWHTFGAAYKAERPALPEKKTVPLSKVIDAANKKHGDGLGPADAVSPVEAVKATMRAVYDGTASIEDFRAGYKRARDAAAVKGDLGKLTKDELISTFGIMARPSEKKDSLVDAAYKAIVRGFSLGKSYGPNSYLMTGGGLENYEKQKAEALDAIVGATTAEDLAAYAAQVKQEREERAAKHAEVAEALQNPKTLAEFQQFLSFHLREGKTVREARMLLTPEQRIAFDDLAATAARSGRKERRDEQRDVRVAGQTVDGQIIATKHTKKGHELFVVQLSERVSREDYDTLNASAKKIGGYYSSYRGGGAVPGFQFTAREQAEAFVKLAQGDRSAASEAAAERRDAFEDDRSQTAVQRLTEMADRLDERADESLGRERKANTARRAGFAARAEAAANADKALAATMRNIAGAIETGKARFLDRVRQKVQVEMLQSFARTAKDAELRAKYDSYAEQQKHQGEPPTAETVEFAEWPTYTAYRSDLASLGRQLLEVDGTKLLGQRLMKVADDVTDAFAAFAKEPGSMFKLAAFSTKGGASRPAFNTQAGAQRAIDRSGYRGKAIPWSVKRGEWTVIMSPSEAISRGIWHGDGDKRIGLSSDFGAELVEKIGRANRRGAKVSVPWQFETAHGRRAAFARMGIETPAEFRAALREFVGLREQPAAPDKVKELERAMVGRRNDGFDFFPTPTSVAEEMVDTSGIEPGMRVLEPSAGMGHIAEQIRAAGAEPDVIEIGVDRRELLEAKGFNVVGGDFLDFNDANHAERGFTFGDLMEAPDGTRGILRGQGGMGSDRVRLVSDEADARELGKFNFSELVGIERRGVGSGYDRILMNPPFSDGRDITHVRHAYSLLKPGGRMVAIMGESAFTASRKQAEEFRAWLDEVGGTDEKLAEGTFLDPSLPVNTGANARMVVIDKADDTRFSRSDDTDERAALQTISDNDELFALPRSNGLTIESIIADIDAAIKVKAHPAEGLDRYELTMPDGAKASIFVRQPSPYGPHSFGNTYNDDNEIARAETVRPGKHPESVPEDMEDVWIDVSKLATGTRGHEVYAIAGALAHNTGRMFIGDPAGLSDEALRRRSEAMLSLALRYGTSSFLAPHPRQRDGSKALGVPPLAWDYTDDLGNIRRLVALNVQALDNAFPAAKKVDFDVATGQFRNADTGLPIDRDRLGRRLFRLRSEGAAAPGAAQAGGRTVARAAVWRALLREEGSEGEGGGGRDGLLARLAASSGAGAASLKDLFSRRPGGRGVDMADAEAVRAAILAEMPGAPTIYLHESIDKAPEALVRSIRQQEAWDIEAAFHAGEIHVFPGNIASIERMLFVVGRHEIRHFGMSVLVPDQRQLGALMHAMWAGNQKLRAAAAKVQKAGHAKARAIAVEEALADMPVEELAALSGWDRFVAAVRQWLRRVASSLRRAGHARLAQAINPTAWTDRDVAAFVARAEDVARRGGRPGPGEAFSRSGDESDARFSRAGELADAFASIATKKGLTDLYNDLTKSQEGFGWWHKTIGTQYQKAARNADFKQVYDGAQTYLHDTSAFANDAAGQAPTLLPQLKGWRDVLRPIALAEKDRAAVAEAVFKGTLEDQKVYDAAELAAMGMDERQRKLYREYRASVDRSLDILVAGDVARMLGKDLPPAIKKMVSDGDTGRFKGLVKTFLAEKAGESQTAVAELKKRHRAEQAALNRAHTTEIRTTKTASAIARNDRHEQEQAALKDRHDRELSAAQATERMWKGLQDRVVEKYMRIDELKEQGYAPLMRFGRYSVYVTREGEDGEREQVYFGLYETEREANKAAREFQASEEGATVQQGVLSEEGYKLFSGMSPETMAVFADLAGMERNEQFEAYLKLAVANRSALKRLIKRKGTAGYSEDLARVLASFVTSNARAASGSLHLGDMSDAIGSMQERRVAGDVIDEAVKLREYVQNQTEEAQAVRGLLFAQYLGGSVASAMVNMTQPFTMTFPFLSQYGGPAKAGARLVAAIKQAVGTVRPNSELGRALEKAEKEGVVSPQEIHQLQAEAARNVGNKPWVRKGVFLWGSLFSLAEQFNRRATFIAAWNTAKAEGMADPFAFAADAVDQTQGVYNRGNKPNWARGALGGTLFTFKQFSISYLEFLSRLPLRERALALAVLMLAAGAEGLPGADDLDDLIDTLAQQAGYDFNSKQAKARFLTSVLGRGGADFLLHGFSAIPGFPLDVSARMSVGNLVPGTSLLLRSETDKGRGMQEILGPVGSLGADALKLAETRDPLVAVPIAIRNLAKGLEMLQTGEYRDTKGRKVMDVTPTDAAAKMVGFQPADVARESRTMRENRQQVSLARVEESEIVSQWAAALVERKPDGVQAARERLRDWNRKNPSSPIAISTAQIARKARDMRMTRDQRFEKAAPKELRPMLQ